MKKITFLVAFALISVFTFGQQMTRVTSESSLKAVKILNSIDNTRSDSKAVMDSLHYDGVNDDGVGTGGAANFGVYAFFPATTLAPQAALSHYILSVKVYINGATDVSSAQLRFLTDTLTSAMVYSQDFTPVEGWNNVMLTAPYAIPSTGNLYVGYNIIATGGYPAGCDAATAPNPNGNWINMGDWAHLNDIAATLTGNWNIRAMVGTLPTTPVAMCTPTSWNVGTLVLPNTATSGTFTLSNVGSSNLTCSGITGLSAPYTTTFDPATIDIAPGANSTFTFTYSPTDNGTHNQTVVLATNGGDITINLSGAAITCDEINTFPWTEGFEGTTFPPTCWTMIDKDGDGYNWERAPDGITSHTGEGCAMSSSYINNLGPLTPDNWLITPPLNINASNLELRFWVAAQDPNWPEEKYSVLVSTTGTSTTDFTEIHTQTLSSGVFSEVALPLSAYNGQSIYIAFRHYDCTDNFFMKIDDISVKVASGVGVNSATASSYNVYPNPAKNNIRVESNQTINMVRILNVLGQEVYSEALSNNSTVINVANLRSGIYFVNIETNEGVKTQRVSIVK
ncbi:MAG: choice-of-anchor J domain-containing protein [Bacteroidales bacterium]|nr:choice-of-anchor J domain-containing protein [Bacteroidales bacterium]MDY0217112.1 choice-of-anchor J domain-containing protein [Bacteroidales bacterium]